MSSSFDDAIAKARPTHAAEAAQAEFQTRLQSTRRAEEERVEREFRALVGDFLQRMGRLGNPGRVSISVEEHIQRKKGFFGGVERRIELTQRSVWFGPHGVYAESTGFRPTHPDRRYGIDREGRLYSGIEVEGVMGLREAWRVESPPEHSDALTAWTEALAYIVAAHQR